jgi:AcrR family transcriptional regulator
MSERRRPRAPQGEGAKLRAELVEAASGIIARAGTAEAVTLRAVAREVGIAAPSIYLHFADRDELLDAVVVQTFADFGDHLRAAFLAAPADPVAQLRAGCLAYCAFAEAAPHAYAVLFGGAITRRPNVGIDTFDLLVEGVAAVISAGRCSPGDPFVVARRVWTQLHGAVTLRAAFPGFPWQPPEDQVEEILTEVAGVGRISTAT